MAKFVIKNRYLMINSVDLSAYIRSADLKYAAKGVDATCDGDDTEINAGGLLNWQVDITLAQDFDALKVDATLFPLVGQTFTIAMRPTTAVKGATNPEYSGTGLLTDYPPLGGKAGDLAETKISIKSAGTLGRSTT